MEDWKSCSSSRAESSSAGMGDRSLQLPDQTSSKRCRSRGHLKLDDRSCPERMVM